MRMKVKIQCELEFILPDHNVGLNPSLLSTGFESAYRMGLIKDMAMIKEVYSKQFGTTSVAEVKDIFFDFTHEP